MKIFEISIKLELIPIREEGSQLLLLESLSLMPCLVLLNENKKQFRASKTCNIRAVINHTCIIISDGMVALLDLRCK